MLVHFLKPTDLAPDDREEILARARHIKANPFPPTPTRLRVGALFFNPSLRTRVSFEQAVWALGGNCQTLNAGGDSWKLEFDPHAVMDTDTVENVVEAAGVLGRYFHILGVRSFPGDQTWQVEKTEPVLSAFARHAGVPVISLEGTTHHPCQSLADHLTLLEHFGPDLAGLPVTLSWAYHPNPLPMAVPNSFALQAALAGTDLTIACPPGWELDDDVMAEVQTAAQTSGGQVKIVHDQAAALRAARVVYMKSWGRKDLWSDKTAERQARAPHRGWILDDANWSHTNNAKVMHCLPVRRNVVIADTVLDSPRSIVLDEAENRLWAQAALLEHFARKQGVL